MQQLMSFLKQYGIDFGHGTPTLVAFGIVFLTAILLHLILHRLVLPAFARRARDRSILWLQVISENKLFQRLAFTLQGIVINVQAVLWLQKGGDIAAIVTTCAQLWIMLYGLLSFFSLLDVILRLSSRFDFASQFPLKGVVQGIKLISAIIVAIMMISLLIGKSPAILISGLGAMAAVLMLVFKDPILGLVAGIQLSANNMLKLGDWLEMTKYGADGSVTDIGLTTVKVRNWDNTITTIPTYALVSDAFKNWSGMSASGGRRIKRCIQIDTTSIRFLTEEDQQKLAGVRLLKSYISDRQQEIVSWNTQHKAAESALDQRRMTNVGTFRAYLNEYLQQHPRIRKDMTLMVRQMEPGAQGLPLEIYAFTSTVVWLEYESIQADIFDHIYAVIGEFGLRVHQAPTGNDVRSLGGREVETRI